MRKFSDDELSKMAFDALAVFTKRENGAPFSERNFAAFLLSLPNCDQIARRMFRPM